MFEKQFMKEYVEYFLHIEHAIHTFNLLIKSKRNSNFQKKLNTCKQECRYKRFTLNELLINPFQRISKYHLLLKDLYKKRDGDSEIKRKIEVTWKTAESVCAYLNEIKRDQECITRIQKIFASINLPPELSSGRLMKEDNIRIKLCVNSSHGSQLSASNGTRARTRTVFLFEKSLLILSKNIFNTYEKRDQISIYDIGEVNEASARTPDSGN